MNNVSLMSLAIQGRAAGFQKPITDAQISAFRGRKRPETDTQDLFLGYCFQGIFDVNTDQATAL